MVSTALRIRSASQLAMKRCGDTVLADWLSVELHVFSRGDEESAQFFAALEKWWGLGRR
jgi:hypothetical protein